MEQLVNNTSQSRICIETPDGCEKSTSHCDWTNFRDVADMEGNLTVSDHYKLKLYSVEEQVFQQDLLAVSFLLATLGQIVLTVHLSQRPKLKRLSKMVTFFLNPFQKKRSETTQQKCATVPKGCWMAKRHPVDHDVCRQFTIVLAVLVWTVIGCSNLLIKPNANQPQASSSSWSRPANGLEGKRQDG